MASLAGKTLFITGASRGIGKAIALRAARDGANVVIAAKTSEPHPKLPGTIFTAAEEIEKAGGKALPVLCDIRFEDQVKKAVEAAVKKFGGIDILVNNASAISLTGTVETPMKKVDLMFGVNVRGTYLCSQACIPYLEKAKNPHILVLSPPLNMKPIWFRSNVAYTISKYGMSMCVLGMSEELSAKRIAVNALWPRTAIYTAAMEMLSGGASETQSMCRKPEILADAAHAILTKPSNSFTGKFLVDEALLREDGVSNFDKYAYDPKAKLMIDFFLDEAEAEAEKAYKAGKEKQPFTPRASDSADKKSASASEAAGGEVQKVFDSVKKLLSPEAAKQANGVFVFDLTGKEPGKWYLDLKSAPGGAVGKGDLPAKVTAGCTITIDSADFVRLFRGELNAMSAFMGGKMKIKGDLMLATKLDKMLHSLRKQAKL